MFLRTSEGVSRTPVESKVGLSAMKVNNFSLFFVAESSILGFAGVLDVSLEISCVFLL